MTTVVAVEGYCVEGAHGVFDWEREGAQTFVVSVWATLSSDASDDELSTSIDYGTLQKAVYSVIAEGDSVKMMETLCEKIAARLRGEANLSALRIRIEKPNAPMPHEGGLAVVEFSWEKSGV